MPRGNLNEVSKGGVAFQEGYIRIDRSVAKVYQYPPNATTKEQSDAFIALVWEGRRLTPEWQELPGEENHVEIVFRMGDLDKIHPGILQPKDFDNMNAEPEDQGDAVGAEGNCFKQAADAKFSFGWGITKESLEKAGFKPEIMGRGILTDFEGTMLHMKTVQGQEYVAKQGKKKGQKVIPENLVCDKIQVFGYDVKKGAGGATAAAAGGRPNGAAAAAGAGAGGATGTAAGPNTGGIPVDEARAEFCSILANASDMFKAKVRPGTAVDRATFQKELTNEMYRVKPAPAMQKAIMAVVKDDALLAQIATDTELYTTDGKTVTLSA